MISPASAGAESAVRAAAAKSPALAQRLAGFLAIPRAAPESNAAETVGRARLGRGTGSNRCARMIWASESPVKGRVPVRHSNGIKHFVLSGYPHLEEAYWFGEGVLSILERKGLWQHPTRRPSGPASIPFAGASSSQRRNLRAGSSSAARLRAGCAQVHRVDEVFGDGIGLVIGRGEVTHLGVPVRESGSHQLADRTVTTVGPGYRRSHPGDRDHVGGAAQHPVVAVD
ncbi:hypothetical protein [Nocardia sp. NBC_01503]|uniref:hypothetical protein n=1 Tax=Nocardia sp. NBC_01503 TaxID=2975997 RepID=UPI003FA52791